MKYSSVKSVTSQLRFPEGKLEKLFDDVTKHHPKPKGSSLKHFENVNWCFVEAAVNGLVQIVFANRKSREIVCADVPVRAKFLVTGTNAGDKGFRLTFLNSLS